MNATSTAALGALLALFLAPSAHSASATYCPSGWYVSGSGCLPGSNKSLPIVPKSAGLSCPSDWHANGKDWCVEN